MKNSHLKMATARYSLNGIKLSKNSSTSKNKGSKQENTHADKIQTNLDPLNETKTKLKNETS